MGEWALSPRALIAAGGVMWLTLLMTSFYQTAKLEAQIRVWEDSMMQQLDSIKHEVRIATRARENKQRDVVNEVTEGLQQLHHRLEHSNNEMVRRLEQVGSVRRAQRSLRTVSQQAAAALDSLGKELSWPLERPASRGRRPCILSHTTTTPHFRLCTLDPEDDPQSAHLHKKGSITLSRAWPLGSLMKAYDGVGTPLVVDVGASIGYFSLFAAQLKARVIAYEEHVDEAELVETSVALNELQERVTVRQLAVSNTAGVGLVDEGSDQPDAYPPVRFVTLDDELRLGGGGAAQEGSGSDGGALEDVYILRISAEGREHQVLEGARDLLRGGHVTFMFIEVAPKRLEEAGSSVVEVLKLLDESGYNVFDDENAADGALEGEDFETFASTIADTALVFAARAT